MWSRTHAVCGGIRIFTKHIFLRNMRVCAIHVYVCAIMETKQPVPVSFEQTQSTLKEKVVYCVSSVAISANNIEKSYISVE